METIVVSIETNVNMFFVFADWEVGLGIWPFHKRQRPGNIARAVALN